MIASVKDAYMQEKSVAANNRATFLRETLIKNLRDETSTPVRVRYESLLPRYADDGRIEKRYRGLYPRPMLTRVEPVHLEKKQWLRVAETELAKLEDFLAKHPVRTPEGAAAAVTPGTTPPNHHPGPAQTPNTKRKPAVEPARVIHPPPAHSARKKLASDAGLRTAREAGGAAQPQPARQPRPSKHPETRPTGQPRQRGEKDPATVEKASATTSRAQRSRLASSPSSGTHKTSKEDRQRATEPSPSAHASLALHATGTAEPVGTTSTPRDQRSHRQAPKGPLHAPRTSRSRRSDAHSGAGSSSSSSSPRPTATRPGAAIDAGHPGAPPPNQPISPGHRLPWEADPNDADIAREILDCFRHAPASTPATPATAADPLQIRAIETFNSEREKIMRADGQKRTSPENEQKLLDLSDQLIPHPSDPLTLTLWNGTTTSLDRIRLPEQADPSHPADASLEFCSRIVCAYANSVLENLALAYVKLLTAGTVPDHRFNHGAVTGMLYTSKNAMLDAMFEMETRIARAAREEGVTLPGIPPLSVQWDELFEPQIDDPHHAGRTVNKFANLMPTQGLERPESEVRHQLLALLESDSRLIQAKADTLLRKMLVSLQQG
ncbi:hypothetical protein [Imbroritus primus]|uniref:hypothetical protein n=1 Tax=Imbroritus primus TaxID=3058603 RepID=UPI003D160EB7